MLLLHAPNERKIRIEVGYGLEGTLTDAITKYIIQNAITPRFKANDFSGGMTRGVDDIIKVLDGGAEEFKQRVAPRTPPSCAALVSRCLVALVLHARFWHRRLHDPAHADGRLAAESRRAAGTGWTSSSSSAAHRSSARSSWRLVGRRRRSSDGFSGGGGIPAAAVRRVIAGEACMITMPTRARIADAIRAAETKTSGEIFCVLAHNAGAYRADADRLGGGDRADRADAADLLTEWEARTVYVLQLLAFILASDRPVARRRSASASCRGA